MRIRHFIIPFLVLSFFSGRITAQFNLNDFLNGARNDVLLYQNQEKSDFLSNNKFRTPYINRFELRLRSNDLNPSLEDYRLRINPTNPWEIIANKNYYKVQTEYLETEYQFFLNEALHKRYQAIIEYLKYIDYQSILEKEIAIKSDQYRIWEMQIVNPDFDISEYIELREDIYTNSYETIEINYQIERLSLKVNETFNYSGKIKDFNGEIITLDKIRSLIETEYNGLSIDNNIMVIKENKANELSMQEYKVQKAEGRRNIGFIQAEYDPKRGDGFENYMGFQIGMRLPITNPDKPDQYRRKLDLIDDEANLKEDKKLMEFSQKLLFVDIEFLFRQYDNLQEEIRNNNIRKLLQLYTDLSPADLLKAQSALTKLQKIEHDLKWQIYKSYIELMFIQGNLAVYPLKNMLSEDLDNL